MNNYIKTFGVIMLLLFSFNLYSQTLPEGVCKVENGQLSFTIDLRWTDAQKAELISKYELDSAMIAHLFAGKRSFVIDGQDWEAKALDNNYLLLHKPVNKQNTLSSFFIKLITNSIQQNNGKPGYVNNPVNFGFNNFKINTVINNHNKITFLLIGFPNAHNVILSGSFNDWNTSELPLIKTDEGWSIEIELSPGKYYYKYIVDGKWIADPENLVTENDGHGGKNSVYYVTNYIFQLKNHNQAKQVILAGSFNNWNESEAEMIKTPNGWVLPVYLGTGIHYYKFIVDGKWILDPDNPITQKNEFGTKNSVITIGEPVYFKLKGYERAEHVYLAGSFNNWNSSELEMYKTDSGWMTPYYFDPGNYEYKFVVDGKWITDPDNSLANGTGDYVNSFFAYKPNHTFILKGHTEAKEVIVTGNFNGWIKHGYHMKKKGKDWILNIYLPPGKTIYRFIVDGKWIKDPDNPNYEENGFNGYNSIIWTKR